MNSPVWGGIVAMPTAPASAEEMTQIYGHCGPLRVPRKWVAKGGIQSLADFAARFASRENGWPTAEFNPWPILRPALRPAKMDGQGRNSSLADFAARFASRENGWPRAELNHRHKDFQHQPQQRSYSKSSSCSTRQVSGAAVQSLETAERRHSKLRNSFAADPATRRHSLKDDRRPTVFPRPRGRFDDDLCRSGPSFGQDSPLGCQSER